MPEGMSQDELHFGPPKSKAGKRDLPLPPVLDRALQRHPKAQAERLWPLGGRSDYVIDNGLGQPYQPASFSGDWRRLAREHGFRGVTFHGLRHGAATLPLASGVPDAVAASIMGHADTRILQRYQRS
jgi:integrase